MRWTPADLVRRVEAPGLAAVAIDPAE